MATKTLPKVPPVRKTQKQQLAVTAPQVPKNGGAAIPADTPSDFTGHLAAGRLKAEGGPTSHIDAINYLLDRAQAVVEIVKEACHSKSGCEFPTEYLLLVMDILREDAAVAQRIADELDHLYREVVPAKAD